MTHPGLPITLLRKCTLSSQGPVKGLIYLNELLLPTVWHAGNPITPRSGPLGQEECDTTWGDSHDLLAGTGPPEPSKNQGGMGLQVSAGQGLLVGKHSEHSPQTHHTLGCPDSVWQQSLGSCMLGGITPPSSSPAWAEIGAPLIRGSALTLYCESAQLVPWALRKANCLGSIRWSARGILSPYIHRVNPPRVENT